MSFTFRPATRQNTPIIVGLSGPTKSGKTYSAHRLARGLANGGVVAMINAEGARGHQYADEFTYQCVDIEPPYSPDIYTEAVKAAGGLSPACLIIDSVTHMHDGPGGMLEWHDAECVKIGGTDPKKQERATWAAWIKPKAAENRFVYALLGLRCPVILCFRAKEKMNYKTKPPTELGWQPITSERLPFETLFTLTLPPRCRGVPDIDNSDMRKPFDTMIRQGAPIDESLGASLRAWAAGGVGAPEPSSAIDAGQLAAIKEAADGLTIDWDRLYSYFGIAQLSDLPRGRYAEAMQMLAKRRATMDQKGT